MIKRILVQRTCPICQKTETVRKDGVGLWCRSCRAKENQKLKKPKDIAGKKFGLITVISFSHMKERAYWKCKCDCGNECILDGARLRIGQTKSCGCLQHSRKGLSKSKEFRTWNAMIQRCYDNKVSHYKRYGAKGITVCDQWRNSFECFLKDMGKRPSGMTLDRIDGSKGYSPENCKWSTYKEQARNKKKGLFIEAFGKKLRLCEWEETTGIKWSTIRKRILNLNWTPEKALSLIPKKKASK